MMKFIPLAFIVLVFHASAMLNNNDGGDTRRGYGNFARTLYNGYMADQAPGALYLPGDKERYGFLCRRPDEIFLGIHGTYVMPDCFKNARPMRHPVLPGLVHGGYWTFYEQYIGQQTLVPICKALCGGCAPINRIVLGGYGMWGALIPIIYTNLCIHMHIAHQNIEIHAFTLGSPGVLNRRAVDNFKEQTDLLCTRHFVDCCHPKHSSGQLGYNTSWHHGNQKWKAGRLGSVCMGPVSVPGSEFWQHYVWMMRHCQLAQVKNNAAHYGVAL